MDQEMLLRLLEDVKKGTMSPQDASAKLARLPFEDIGFAKVDHHRSLRTGLPEVILASGKTPEQVAEIFERMAASGVEVLATRADVSTFDAVRQRTPAAKYFPVPRAIALRQREKIADLNQPRIAVVCAGTSDIPVAEEAAVTIDIFGGEVDRFYDVGVAGLHRLLTGRGEQVVDELLRLVLHLRRRALVDADDGRQQRRLRQVRDLRGERGGRLDLRHLPDGRRALDEPVGDLAGLQRVEGVAVGREDVQPVGLQLAQVVLTGRDAVGLAAQLAL